MAGADVEGGVLDGERAAIVGVAEGVKRADERREARGTAVFEIEEADAPQRIWIFLGCFGSLKENGLVAPESGGFIDLSVRSSKVIEIAFGPNNEK